MLAFGHKFPSEGGSSYYLGDDGTPWTERPRETWITCRMAHVYSIEKMWDVDLSAISAEGTSTKRFDFVVKTTNTIYLIETNFYTAGGSKLNETARSYKMIILRKQVKLILHMALVFQLIQSRIWL